MAPPQLKRLGRNIVRASDDVPVRLYGPHLFWFSHRASWPSATASTTELDWVDEVFGASTAGWGSSLATFWLSTIGTGKVNAAGTQTTTGEATWLAHVDGLVSRATTANTYVLFVWAVHEPQGTHDRIIDAEGIATLRFMARRFSGNPAVLLAIQAEVPFTDTTANRTALRAACVQAISQIRAEDPVMLIGIPGLNWSQRVQWFLDNPINDANLFVKPHLYEGSLSGGSMALTIVTSGAQAVYDAGWPIIVGECGVGSRSNAADLAYLFDHAETNIWGWQGWALMYGISLSLLVSPGDIETDLTAWGQQVKDESQYLYGLSAPGVPPAPGTPPTIVVPASADTITNGITKTWTDISYDTTVTNATDKLEVEHAAAYGSVVFQKPAGALLDSGTYTTLRVLLNATTAQLQSLRGVLYRSHESGGEVQIMGEDTLLPYVSSLGDGWYIADIPVPAAGFESTSIAKVALQNVSSGPLAPYYIARTALLQDPSQAGLVMVTQPGASEVGQAVAGPPTVQANDQDGNPLAGVEVTVSLNKGTFLSGSVTTRLTDTNGIAVFDFLFIGVADTGYTLTFTAPGVA